MPSLGLVALVGCLCLSPLASAQDARPGASQPPAAGQTAPAATKPAGAAQAGQPAAPAGQPAAAATPAAAPAAGAAGAARAAGAAPAAAGQRAATPADGAAQPPERQTYYLALLRRGPKFIANGQPGAQVMAKQHEAHVAQLANLGVLALGGTCGEQAEGSDPLVELCVIDAPSLEKARRYVEQDPTVIAGHLRAEFVPWMGPKGLCLKLPAAEPAPATAAATDGAAPGAQPAAKPMQVNPNRPNAAQAKPAAPSPAGAAAPATPAAAPAPAPASPPAPAPAPAAGTPAKPASKPKPAAGSVPPPKTSPKS